MLALAEESVKKNLKVGVGLMCRHCKARSELYDRIKDGEIGDIMLLRAYRMHGPVGYCFARPEAGRDQRTAVSDPAVPRLPVGQRRRLQRFLHPQHRRMLLDEGCLAGQGQGHWAAAIIAATTIDQNFDIYSVEYTFADGAKLFLDGRDDRRLLQGVRQLRPRHQGLGRHLDAPAHRRPVPHLQGPER